MFDFTHHNHYQFKYNNRSFILRTRPTDILSFSVGQCQQPPNSWFSECIRSCQLIYNKLKPGQNIKVFYGGGLDSEIMVQSFLLSGVPFSCLIIDNGADINGPEVVHAVNYCTKYKIDYSIVTINPEDIIKRNLHLIYYQEFQVKQIANMMIIRAVEMLHKNDVYVLGGDPLLSRNIDLDQFYISDDLQFQHKWYHQMKEDFNTCFTKYSLIEGACIISEFFSYTPEQLFSFLTEPVVEDLVNDRSIYKYGLASSKFKVYGRHFTFQARARQQGHKAIGKYNNRVYRDLGVDASGLDVGYKTHYNKLIEQLSYD